MSLEKWIFPPWASCPSHDTWHSNHTAPQDQLEDQNMWWRTSASRHLGSPNKKQVFKFNESNSLFSGNKHPPTITWSLNKASDLQLSQYTRAITVLLRKTASGKWGQRSAYSASWAGDLTSVTQVKQLCKQLRLALLWTVWSRPWPLILACVLFPFHAAGAGRTYFFIRQRASVSVPILPQWTQTQFFFLFLSTKMQLRNTLWRSRCIWCRKYQII